MYKHLRFFKDLRIEDVPQVGGKNASLGEMFSALTPKGIHLPNGYSTTSDAYRYFLESAGIREKIVEALTGLDVRNVPDLQKRGAAVRQIILDAKLPADFEAEVRQAYKELCDVVGYQNLVVVVRSSATAEDLPNASFAGQQDTYLNISGEDAVVNAVQRCIASLFTDRAIVYRVENKFDHMQVALAVGVQQMVAVRSKASGVMFTLDTETGFRNAVVISSIYGLGENIVQGRVSPDEFTVFKPTKTILRKKLGSKQLKLVPTGNTEVENLDVPEDERRRYSLSDEQVLTLASWGMAIEEHYKKAMDIEWALDEDFGTLYIVQARPETVQSQRDPNIIEEYVRVEDGEVLVTGTSVGNKIGVGKASVIQGIEGINDFKEGDVLVTTMTDPDWVPIMKKAAAIVTNKGGRTCHAAIVSRELGIPCIVGTDTATERIKAGEDVTVSCNEGDEGKVYRGRLKFEVRKENIAELKRPKTKIMLNIGSPEHAFQYSHIPNDGVGLAREEFIIDAHIKVHPLALLRFDSLKDEKARAQIEELTYGYADKSQYFVDKLAEGIAMIGAAFHPNDVIVRFSDFKTNEYANLIGGAQFEPEESNPMIGWRGASRYYSDEYRDAFKLECYAMKRVRDDLKVTNVKAMIPFCRTLDEADKVLAIMAESGLRRGENGFEVYMMVEIPSNVILAAQFAERFDGFSIGSNDLTQLTLGVDRDSNIVNAVYDENNEAVKELVRQSIRIAKEKGVKIGICGQGPSDSPAFAEFLVREGIDSISLSPDTVVKTRMRTFEIESKL